MTPPCVVPTFRPFAAENLEFGGFYASSCESRAKAQELAAKMSSMAPLTVLGVLHALPRIQDMSEADGLFVESLMAALAQSGAEAAARLADFVGKRAAKVTSPAESLMAVSQGAASGIAAAADTDDVVAVQRPEMHWRTDDRSRSLSARRRSAKRARCDAVGDVRPRSRHRTR